MYPINLNLLLDEDEDSFILKKLNNDQSDSTYIISNISVMDIQGNINAVLNLLSWVVDSVQIRAKKYDVLSLPVADAFHTEAFYRLFQKVGSIDIDIERFPYLINSDVTMKRLIAYYAVGMSIEAKNQVENIGVQGRQAIDVNLILLAPIISLLFPYVALELTKDDPVKHEKCLKRYARQLLDAHGRFFVKLKSRDDLDIIKETALVPKTD